VDETRKILKYVNLAESLVEDVDDGVRVSPSGHVSLNMVGADADIMLSSDGRIAVAYQDSTLLDLMVAFRSQDDHHWEIRTVAGNEEVFTGSRGFYSDGVASGSTLFIVDYLIDNQVQPPSKRLGVSTFSLP